MKVSFLFAWYDFWIGLFWDSKKKWLYILPIPCFGIILKFEKSNKKHDGHGPFVQSVMKKKKEDCTDYEKLIQEIYK